MTKPYFWNMDKWRTALDPKDPPSSWNIDLSHCTRDFQNHWADATKVMLTLTDQSSLPVTFAMIKEVATAIDEWFFASEQFFTYPLTVKGIDRALDARVKALGSLAPAEPKIIALALLQPQAFSRVLAAMPEKNLTSNWQAVRQFVLGQLAASTPSSSDASLVHEQKPDPKNHRSSDKIFSKDKAQKPEERKRDFSDQIKKEGQKIASWIDEVDAMGDAPLALRREKWDDLVKREILDTKGLGPTAAAHWFEYVAFPALCTLSKEQLEKVMMYWPEHAYTTFADPVKTMAHSPFWSYVRLLRQPERGYILDDVLPTLVQSDGWRFEQKQEMLSHMIEKTESHDWLFEERLNLWLRWGGDLDAPWVDSKDENPSVFAPQSTQTVREWLLAQNVEAWSKVLSEHIKPSTPRP